MDEFEIVHTIKETVHERVCIVKFKSNQVLLKQIKTNDVVSINMLKNEVNILYRLRNENFVPKLLSYKFNENNNYILMELINGQKLNNIKKLNFKNSVLLLLNILSVVEKIHSYGVVHCDLKPENILIDENNNIKLIDYGISVYNHLNYFPGYVSVSYCSPEQILNKKITFDTDLFALGVIFYIILFRKKPFNGSVKEIKIKKVKGSFESCNNDLLNFIFFEIIFS